MPKPIIKLKDQARLCEQREEWERAAHLYQQVLRAAEDEGDIATELGLYNRVGDIYLRLGRPQDAVIFFEQAADHYAADGLYNNAIALCNKALRHVPGRLELYRKLGRLSASQGFATEARRWFLEFAERNLRQGALEEAFGALGELADLTDDPEVRELLARQLNSHGRSVDAVDEFRRAYATRVRAGDRAGADAVRDEVRVLDAAAADALDEGLAAAPDLAGPLGGLPLLEELGPDLPDAEEVPASTEARSRQPVEPVAPAPPAEDQERAAAEVAIAAALVEEALALAPAAEDERAAAAARLEGFDPTLLGDVAAAATSVITPDLERPEELSPDDVPPLPLPLLEVGDAAAAEGGEGGALAPERTEPELTAPGPTAEAGELELAPEAAKTEAAERPEPQQPVEEMPPSELTVAAEEQFDAHFLEDEVVEHPWRDPEPPEFSLDLTRRESAVELPAPDLLAESAALSEAIEEGPGADVAAQELLAEPGALLEAVEEAPGAGVVAPDLLAVPAALSEAIEEAPGAEPPAPDSIIEPGSTPVAALNLELPSLQPSRAEPPPGPIAEPAAEWVGAPEPIEETPTVGSAGLELAPEPPIELTVRGPTAAPPAPISEVFVDEIPGLELEALDGAGARELQGFELTPEPPSILKPFDEDAPAPPLSALAAETPSALEFVGEPPAADLPGLELPAEPPSILGPFEVGAPALELPGLELATEPPSALELLAEPAAPNLPGLELGAEPPVAFESSREAPPVGLPGLELTGETAPIEGTRLEWVAEPPAGLEPIGEAPGGDGIAPDRIVEPIAGLESGAEAAPDEPAAPDVAAEPPLGLEPIGEAPTFEEAAEAPLLPPEPELPTRFRGEDLLPPEWLDPEPAESTAPAEPWIMPSEELPWASTPTAAPAAEAGPWASEFEAPPWPTTDEPAAEPFPFAELSAQAPPVETPAPDGSEAAADRVPGPSGADQSAQATSGPPEDPIVLFARSLYAHGQPAAGRVALKQLLADADKRGDSSHVLAVLEALTELEPTDLDAHQRRVELRFQLHGARAAVPALLALAGALEGAGQATRASAAYQQVLDIDPSNVLAGTALRKERAGRPMSEHEGGYVDLGALLQSEEDLPQGTTRFVVSETEPTGDEERDFVEMLEQFKEKVAQHMGEDPNAHYDLGLAYKEMGLLDEAVAEFQVALRNGQDRLKVLEELGRCFLLKEEPRIAVRLLSQALAVPGRAEVEYMGVNYLLGRSYEVIGETDAARDAYERVIGVDIQFNDVAERLARL